MLSDINFVNKSKQLHHSSIIAYHKAILAFRTDVAIRMRRTIAIDVRIATTMMKVISVVTARR